MLNAFIMTNSPNFRRGRDCMVVGFTTTYVISAYHHWCCEFESRSGRGVQHYVMKFVSDLQQVGGFLRVLLFPPSIKLSATISLKYTMYVKHHRLPNSRVNGIIITNCPKTITLNTILSDIAEYQALTIVVQVNCYLLIGHLPSWI
jgi:hypothetical protein